MSPAVPPLVRRVLVVLVVGLAFVLVLVVLLAVGDVGALGQSGEQAGLPAGPIGDIPPAYLAAYVAAAGRYRLGPEGWAQLAGIGYVETRHGTLEAPGVRSGRNTHGCCAGPMQFNLDSGTWAAYRIDGDGDGALDIYDPEDAIFSAANKVRRDGAPGDWHGALLRYNNAEWYVRQVQERARHYLELARAGGGLTPARTIPGPGGQVQLAWVEPASRWVEIPVSYTGDREQIDAAVLSTALWIADTFGLRISDGGRRPGDRAYSGGNHSCARANDFSGPLASMRALEDWAEGAGFPEVLGPRTDPAEHADHTHVAYGSCDGGRVLVVVPAGAGGQPAGPSAPAGGAGFVFPVRHRAARFSDDFYAHRASGGHCISATTHCAIDILAPRGAPIVSPVAGTLSRVGRGGLGGNRLWVETDTGHRFYLAHLDTFARGVRDGRRVSAGALLGTVGNTGAPGAPTHLHLAWEGPDGFNNPYQLLRQNLTV